MAIKVANNQSLTAITALPSAVSGGAMTLISTTTVSSSSTVNITSGIDSTYKEYIIKVINAHPENNTQLEFHCSIDGGSNFNTNMTTTAFHSFHKEDGSGGAVGYRTGDDLANGTDEDSNTSTYASLSNSIGNNNNMCGESVIHLFDPSNTTFVKHFIAVTQTYMDRDTPQLASPCQFIAGYVNTTSAVNAVSFRMYTGDFDSGTIKLYGIS